MSKYLELAKKLKSLADKGIGGEKVNAEAALKKIMSKHGISVNDLEDENVVTYFFNVSAEDKKLFAQICSTVLGKSFQVYKVRKRRNVLAIDTTISNGVEIEGKFNFYKAAFKEKYEIFYSAFIEANRLYPKNDEGKDISKLSEQELNNLKQVKRMAAGIERELYLKQLSEKL